MFLTDVLHNRMLIVALVAWASAQVIKALIYAVVNREFSWKRLLGDGGMPSGHSATVTSLAASAGMLYGFDSSAFAISTVLAIVVMHDAMGVRREAGKHAETLNEIMMQMNKDTDPEELLKEFLGHSPLQVFFGALLGLVVAFLVLL